LRGVPEDRVADEAMTACAETISELRQIPGVAGVHVMAVGNEHRIPAILQRAGIEPMAASEAASMGASHAG
jgi:methylenetetrahydrofolate reductase (NADPH)